MKLIIQIGAQSVEYTVIGPKGVALTNQQAQLAIDLTYTHLSAGQEDALTGIPTLTDKAAWILGRMADGFVRSAILQRRLELQTGVESTVSSELG